MTGEFQRGRKIATTVEIGLCSTFDKSRMLHQALTGVRVRRRSVACCIPSSWLTDFARSGLFTAQTTSALAGQRAHMQAVSWRRLFRFPAMANSANTGVLFLQDSATAGLQDRIF